MIVRAWAALSYWCGQKLARFRENRLRRAWLRRYRGYPSEQYMVSEPFHFRSSGSATSGPAYGVTGQQNTPHWGSEP